MYVQFLRGLTLYFVTMGILILLDVSPKVLIVHMNAVHYVLVIVHVVCD